MEFVLYTVVFSIVCSILCNIIARDRGRFVGTFLFYNPYNCSFDYPPATKKFWKHKLFIRAL